MIRIEVTPELLEKCPNLRLDCLICHVKIAPSQTALLDAIQSETQRLHHELTTNSIHDFSTIQDTRMAYKACGKEPSRYRPSAEALLRRVVQGKGLYQVNNVVDALNLISIQSGFSIGGYDLEKIQGNIQMGIGEKEEPYNAIGRGTLNIEFLPLLRDQVGAFGSPTSDSARTMITPQTEQFLMVFFNFGGSKEVIKWLTKSEVFFTKFANGKNFQIFPAIP